jgi:cold shock CspA family protein
VQATVYRYDPDSGAGSVLTDDGVVIPFGPEALRLSGLRHLRPGQRLSVELATAEPKPNTGAGPNAEPKPNAAEAETGRITGLSLGTIGSTHRADGAHGS